jgi:predicted RNA binding protein YcfA (HicA-like mRNA interferase family)
MVARSRVTAYSYVVRAEKLLARAINNPAGLSFSEFEALMRSKGWMFRRQKGSHRVWASPMGYLLPIQKTGKHAKQYQVRQFLARLESENQ